MAAELGVPELVVHAFTDGRDTSPTGGERYLAEVQGWVREGRQRPHRHGHRALLRDGPRQALGAHAAALSTCCCDGEAPTTPPRRSTRSAPPTSATRGDEFIEPTIDRRRRRVIRPAGQRHRLQLPSRPDAPADAAARARGRPLHDADRVRGGLALAGRLPARAPRDHAAAGHRRDGRRAAARRRDGEVPARHVLLRRRRGGPGGGRAPRARALAARRPDLRPQARDERARGRRRVRAARGAEDAAALRDHQLRQPRHGRPHRGHPGRREGVSRRSTPAWPRSSTRSRPPAAR